MPNPDVIHHDLVTMRTIFATLQPGRGLAPRFRPARERVRRAATGAHRRLPPAGGDAAFMLLEVVISALLVALIAIGTFAGLEGAQRAGTDVRTHAEATTLAQQDEERLRGLTATALTELVKKGSEAQSPVTLGKITFTITSSASFVSAAKNSLSCETSGGGANYIQTTSSVRWTGLKSTRPAVTQSSIISTLATGLLVKVMEQNEEPVQGATVTLTGADSGSQSTNAAGCALFVGLTAGSVTVAVSKSGWVEVNGKSTGTSKSASVVDERTETSEAQIAEPGAIKAEFESNGKLGVEGDTFVAYQSGIGTPSFFVAGTAGNYETSVTSEQTLFPFAKSKVAEPYTVYAGDCTANNPETVTASGEKLKPREAKVEPNGTASVSKPLEVPEVKVLVDEGTSGTPKKHVTSPESVYITNKECEKQKSQNYTGEVPYKHKVALIAKGLEHEGELSPETAHQPFAKKLEFCVQAKVAKYDYRYRKSFENKTKAGISLGTVYLKESGEKGSKESTLLPCP